MEKKADGTFGSRCDAAPTKKGKDGKDGTGGKTEAKATKGNSEPSRWPKFQTALFPLCHFQRIAVYLEWLACAEQQFLVSTTTQRPKCVNRSITEVAVVMPTTSKRRSNVNDSAKLNRVIVFWKNSLQRRIAKSIEGIQLVWSAAYLFHFFCQFSIKKTTQARFSLSSHETTGPFSSNHDRDDLHREQRVRYHSTLVFLIERVYVSKYNYG